MTKPIDPADFTDDVEGADNPLAFRPVPVATRHFGWSAERQAIFIRALAETACVSDACETAGVTPRSAYRLRTRPGTESFDRAWRQALVIGAHRLTTIAFEREIHGTPRAVWHKGVVIGEERVPSDRLLMYLLQHYDRSRYGNLSSFLPCDVADPVGEAREALPGLIDALTDDTTRPPGDGQESFRLLPELE